MAKSYSHLLSELKRQVRTIGIDELRERLAQQQSRPFRLVDVRERDEFRQGYIPGALHVPRSHLEMQIEQTVPDREQELVVYCAAGARSVLAVRTLIELGYRNVVSADPGFFLWKERGFPIDVPPALTDGQLERYSRHVLLPEVGEAGQARLLAARVLLLGAGGLGSPAALYLAAAGIGRLGFVDSDTVELSNLQRQILHATSRLGVAKVDSAESTIADLNPDVTVVKYQERLQRSSVDRILGDGWDVIVDGCDNFPTRYLVNDASLVHRIPVVHGSIYRFEGQLTTFLPGNGPCYRCLYPEPPPANMAPTCSEAGVLGILPGVIGTLQATEAVKVILGAGELLVGRLLTYDALAMQFRQLKFRRDRECAACGDSPTIREYVDYEGFCAGPSH